MLIRLIGRYLRPYSGLIAGVIVVQLIAAIAGLWLPSLNAEIIDNGVAKGDTDYIWRHGGLMLAVATTQMIAQVCAAYLGARAAMGFGRDVRSAVFHRTLEFSTREMNEFGAPSLITRSTNDVQQVQQLIVMTCTFILSAPITMTGGVIMALREDIGLSWLIMVAVTALAVVIGIIGALMVPRFQRNQISVDAMNRVTREQVTGIRVIRAFTRENRERERFAEVNQDLLKLGLGIGTLFAIMMPFVILVLNLSSVGVIWFGSMRVDAGEMQVGQLTAYLSYLMQILMSVMMATMMMMIGPRAAVCAKRIMEVLNTESSVIPPTAGATTLPERGSVAFSNVSFAYPGAEAPVLSDLNFALKPGTTTAVVGSTGAGKSTLVNLIPRLFDATAGTVSVNGVDVREIDEDTLWAKVGLVPQKPYLFSGTVRSNMQYGRPDATDEEIWEALRVAQAADFVEEMEGQLAAPISQGGTNVSGGQRQRLSIARALVKSPEIYIFDDAFSALDVATDARLRAALAPFTSQAAVLIVAQRISTVKAADQIIVLEGGRIVGLGTHHELMDSNPTYQEIVSSQMTLEEAA